MNQVNKPFQPYSISSRMAAKMDPYEGFKEWLESVPKLGTEETTLPVTVQVPLLFDEWFIIAHASARSGYSIGEIISMAVNGVDLIDWSNFSFKLDADGEPITSISRARESGVRLGGKRTTPSGL